MAGIESIDKLANELSRLPGIGKKTAQRLAFHIVGLPEEQVRELAVAIYNGKKNVHLCPVCYNLTDREICSVCGDDGRDRSIICVVKDARDVNALERVRDYNGMYHVLGGVISPMDGIGPEDINLKSLIKRLQGQDVEEVIIATNPTIQGEATAMYISKLLNPAGIKVSRIAHGIPVGSDLEFADEVTLLKSFEGRRTI